MRVRKFPDDQVNIKCVSPATMRTLNKRYRGKDAETNVLTFNYGPAPGEVASHDIALCLPVAEREAGERGVALREYVALLLAHAFLHATGMDHEREDEEALHTRQMEKQILKSAGFPEASLIE